MKVEFLRYLFSKNKQKIILIKFLIFIWIKKIIYLKLNFSISFICLNTQLINFNHFLKLMIKYFKVSPLI